MYVLFVFLFIWVVVFTFLFYQVEEPEDRNLRTWFRFVTVQAALFTTIMTWVGFQCVLDWVENYAKRNRS